jgi:hypothetical protein
MFLGNNFIFEKFIQYFSLLILLCCYARQTCTWQTLCISLHVLELVTQTDLCYRVYQCQLESIQIYSDLEHFVDHRFWSFKFHKVVRQYFWGGVGILYVFFLELLVGFVTVKSFQKSVKVWRNYCHEFGVHFLWKYSIYSIYNQLFAKSRQSLMLKNNTHHNFMLAKIEERLSELLSKLFSKRRMQKTYSAQQTYEWCGCTRASLRHTKVIWTQH